MRQDEGTLLATAVQAMRSTAAENKEVMASAHRIADRLGIEGLGIDKAGIEEAKTFLVDQLESCGDVQRSKSAYRAGTVSSARSLLIENHLSECTACRGHYRHGQQSAGVDWTLPVLARGFVWRPQMLGWTLAPLVAVLVCLLFVYRTYWHLLPGVQAQVQTIEGSAYRLSKDGSRPLSAGDEIGVDEHVRTTGGAHAVLRLRDGSLVEVNGRTELGVGSRGQNTTLTLAEGDVIVQAAKRTSGHLYVNTPDCRLAVTGTVFSVDAGIKGSRVAVVEGSVRTMHGGIDTMLHAGDQVSTSDNLSPEPVSQQIAWSHDRERYALLLAQFATLQHRLEKIPLPQPRYTSDLLERVPADTLLYISVPNLGDFVTQANSIFEDQLKQSAVLRQWWSQGSKGQDANLRMLVEKIRGMSQYLGDEIVIAGVQGTSAPSFAILADLRQGGLGDFLKSQFPAVGSSAGITVFDPASLASTLVSAPAQSGEYAVIRPHEVVFSNSIATLKQMNAQLDAGSSSLSGSGFGLEIKSAYARGAGVFLAADMQRMMGPMHARQRAQAPLAKSGIETTQYLLAEHRERNGQPENHLSVAFAGPRQGVASWLSSPGPMGSLDFVTPNAAVVLAALSKDPKLIADDLLSMTSMAHAGGNTTDNTAGNTAWNEAEAKLQISLRNDLAATLGGEFLVSLDGPVLPRPSWKAVIEVNDAQRLEHTLERLAESSHRLAQNRPGPVLSIQTNDVGGQRFYALQNQTTGNVLAAYTFADGYLLLAPDRALLMEAMHTHAAGSSLARSAAFKALLPKDQNENYSAIAYQNLSPVLTPLLAQLSAPSSEALRKFAVDARPTAICVWGNENRIEAASDSNFSVFDLMTLGALLPSRNNPAPASVRD